MKISSITTFFILFFINYSFGQMTIHVTHDRQKANVIVYKTKFFSEANLVLKKTWSILEAEKPYHWYFVSNNLAAEADWIVYYTDNMKEADHVVFFTENPKLLGSYSNTCGPIDDVYKLKSYSNKQVRKWIRSIN